MGAFFSGSINNLRVRLQQKLKSLGFILLVLTLFLQIIEHKHCWGGLKDSLAPIKYWVEGTGHGQHLDSTLYLGCQIQQICLLSLRLTLDLYT